MTSILIVIYLSTLLASGLIGLFVLLQDRFSNSNKTFFGLTFFQVFWILSLFFGYYYAFSKPPVLNKSELFVQLAYANGLMAVFFLNVFLYYFPRKSISFGKIKTWSYILVTVTIAILAAFTDLVHDQQFIENGVYYADSYGPLYSFYSLLLLVSLLLATYIATRKLLILKGLEKRKMVYVTIGCWMFGLTTITTNIIFPLYGIAIWGSINFVQISPAYVLFFILPTFYSIYKYRFFNFSYASFHILKLIILYAIFLISTFTFFILFLNLVPNLGPVPSISVSALMAYIFSEQLKVHIPEFVPENLRAFRNAIREFKAIIFLRNTIAKLQEAIDQTFLVRLNFVNAKLYVVRKKNDNLGFPVYTKNAFTKALLSYKKDILVFEEIQFRKINASAKKTLLSAMKKLEADICVPLFSENNLIGFFTLKKRGANVTYAKEEIDEIIDIKRSLEIALMNLLLKLNLEEENNLMKAIIDDKTKQLKKKIDEINELLMQQSDFIAVTAHEFRTPLSIASFQMEDLMASKKAKSLSEELHVLDDSLANLKTLTEKLFAVQQYDLNKVELKLEKVEISSYLKHLSEDFSSILKNKKIAFTSVIKLKKTYAKIDQAQFRQVLHNLFGNAAKFTPHDGKIVMEAMAEKGMIIIKVSDNGEGIPDDLKEAIFEKFRTKKAGAGIGLGLYLCKKIMELHKGRIWVEDNDMGGASFCLSLKQFSR